VELIPGVCKADWGIRAYILSLVLHGLDHVSKLGSRQFLAVDVFGADSDAEDLVGVFPEPFNGCVSLLLEDVAFTGRPDSNDRLRVGALESRE
jgi:hypothetical protein